MTTELAFNKNRNDLQIVAEILEAANGRVVGKSELMRKCNLNSEMLARYLQRLLEQNNLIEVNAGYQTTAAGGKFLDQIKDVLAQWSRAEKREVAGQ